MTGVNTCVPSNRDQASLRRSLSEKDSCSRAADRIISLGIKLRRAGPEFWISFGLMFAAFLIRLPNLGNPAYEVDEEFYLLVGDRLLHGMLPYVDIWDRKPIGLFLIYSAIRLLGGDGVLQYQIVATLFAGATSVMIHRIARPVAGQFGAVVAGLAYLLWIETVEGGGGQAPIFYNLFVAGTAACTLGALRATDGVRFRRLSFLAMMLGGIAIQVKYTAVFEVAYFGALLAWRTRRHTASPAAAVKLTFALSAVALAPTFAALAFYTMIGQFQAFWFANFVSIFQRAPAYPAELHHRLWQMVQHVIALMVCYAACLWQLRADNRADTRRWQWVMAGWLLAALAGFFSVGALYFHYMLPLFVPLTIAASPIFRRWPLGAVMAGIILWLPFSNLDYPDFGTTRYFRTKTDAIEAMIPPEVDRGCMQMFAGPPILYLRTHACFVTRYVFPDHLVSTIETHALGIDTKAEMRHVLAKRPRALVIDDQGYKLDPGSFTVLEQLRSRYYHRVGGVVMEKHRIDVWVLNQPPK